MPPERDMVGFTDLTHALGAGATASESLRQSQEEIEELVRRGKSRPSWQPECPHLTADEALVLRLALHACRLSEAHKQLIDRQADLLRDAQSRRPFVCPSELQKRIDYLNRLRSHARRRNVKDFLILYQRVPQGTLDGLELRECLQRLSSIPKCGLEQAARRFADEGGVPKWSGTP
jgi:hypothetical protein